MGEESILIRVFELAATLGTGTVFGGLILWWVLRVASKKFDENTLVLLAVLQSMTILRTQHLLHEATVHGTNTSTGATQEERDNALAQKIRAIESENQQANEAIMEVKARILGRMTKSD